MREVAPQGQGCWSWLRAPVPCVCARLRAAGISTATLAAGQGPAALPLPLVGPGPTPPSAFPHTAYLADAARAFHESLYKQKLASLLEKKKLTDEDDAALKEMQASRARGCA